MTLVNTYDIVLVYFVSSIHLCHSLNLLLYFLFSYSGHSGIYILEWFQMKTHFFKQTSGSDKVLAHAIRSNLRQILFENFHG